MIGAGKYDRLCTLVRDRAHARGVVLIVIEGGDGNGFSVQLPLELYPALVLTLRDVADQIERDVFGQGPPS